MIAQKTREHIWYQLVSMERWVRYYELLYKRYRLHRLIIRWTVAVGSMGLLGALLFQEAALSQTGSSITVTILAVGVAVVTAWDLAENPSDKAATVGKIWNDISFLRLEYETVWDSLESRRLTDEQAYAQSKDLIHKVHLILEKLDVGTSNSLNERAARTAYTYLNHRYSHAA